MSGQKYFTINFYLLFVFLSEPDGDCNSHIEAELTAETASHIKPTFSNGVK